MKKISFIAMIAVMIFTAGSVFAQCKVKSGDLKVLKGQSVVKMQFDYSEMRMGKKKTEADYIKERTEEMNKKKPGSGDDFLQKWNGDKTARFQPTFVKNFNGETEGKGLVGKEDANDAKYTLNVHTTYMEPGYNVGVSRMNAYIAVVITLYETSNPGKVLATMEMKNEQSINMMGYDYDKGARIQSAYDRAGEHLGKCIVKYGLK